MPFLNVLAEKRKVVKPSKVVIQPMRHWRPDNEPKLFDPNGKLEETVMAQGQVDVSVTR